MSERVHDYQIISCPADKMEQLEAVLDHAIYVCDVKADTVLLRMRRICDPVPGIEIEWGTDYGDYTFKSTGTPYQFDPHDEERHYNFTWGNHPIQEL